MEIDRSSCKSEASRRQIQLHSLCARRSRPGACALARQERQVLTSSKKASIGHGVSVSVPRQVQSLTMRDSLPYNAVEAKETSRSRIPLAKWLNREWSCPPKQDGETGLKRLSRWLNHEWIGTPLDHELVDFHGTKVSFGKQNYLLGIPEQTGHRRARIGFMWLARRSRIDVMHGIPKGKVGRHAREQGN
ncbi:hypothetical protein VNO77_43991 [Canavalia gladiata]|uniref:Uncharacterized protein n=1 Tax=Canavalia gladiata TaxID=3824 RepID=A0AAN9JVU7_CANGL